MTAERSETALSRNRVVVTATVVGAVVVAGAVVAILLSGDDQRERSDATAATSSRPAAATTTSESAPAKPGKRVAVEESGGTLTDFLEVSEDVLRADAPASVDLDQIAVGYAKGELEATAAEFEDNGWRQEGTATVTDTWTVRTDLDATPPAVTLGVCVDSSDVRIIDESGRTVPDSGPDRVPHLYTLVLDGKTWKVSEHTFPDESTC